VIENYSYEIMKSVISHCLWNISGLTRYQKGQSEFAYPRRTDNTMAKRKRTKGQTTINKTYI
jgi:hypothetical protein